MKVDVLVVGLGPAGASLLSNLSALIGNEYSILGIDKRDKPGFPVQCGEFMPSPDEMEILTPNVKNPKELFQFDPQYISTKTNRISFYSPVSKVISTSFNGYTIHRGKWNEDLISEAKRKGAEVWTSTKAVGKKNNTIMVSRNGNPPEAIEAKIIVGADGPRSRIARWSDIAEKRTKDHFVYAKQYVMTNIQDPDYDPSDVQMFFGSKYAPGAYAWIIPKSKNTANVGVGIRTPMVRGRITTSKALENLVTVHPHVSKVVKGAEIISTIGGFVPVGLPLKKTVDDNSQVLLLGDAASQVVSHVGGGIPPSMAVGSIAADSIEKNLTRNESLSSYEVNWRKQLFSMFLRSYKLRCLFDKLSTGNDSRLQWYLNRLNSSDIDKVVHCRVPWKVTLGIPFIRLLNLIIK
jgi:geranylgeranyl reductase family protein